MNCVDPGPFERTELLLGREAMCRLADSRVAVFGLGGVGGYAVEALARSGIGALDLVDDDRVAESNLNRQLLATLDTLGQPKTAVAAERVRLINPSCRVTVHQVFYLPETRHLFDFRQYDYVVDAIDTVAGKLALIQQAREAGTPVISCMGAGNKLDPAAFRVADLYETTVCPLARIMRKECRRRGIDRLKVVYSLEPPQIPRGVPSVEQEPDQRPGKSSRRSVPGSVSFVPSVAGLILAGEVVRDLIGIPREKQNVPAAP